MKKSIFFLFFCSLLIFSETSIAQLAEKQILKSESSKLMAKKSAESINSEQVKIQLDSVPSNSNNKSINNINNGMPNRISMNVTVPKQTQGATFGEKVNAGLQAAGSAIAQKNAGVTISGNLWFDKIEFPHTVNSVSSVGNLAGGAGGGAAAASYAATGRISNSTDEKASGISTVFFAREAGSGMASGKRQYQPIYISKNNSSCNNCIVTLKKSEVVFDYDIKKNQAAKNANPYYKNNSNQGEMVPEKSTDNRDNDCDGIENSTVVLINTATGQEVAKTLTKKCGSFSFQNIPIGTYSLQVIGNFLSRKGYDYYMAKSADLKGKVQQNEETFKLVLTKNEDPLTENTVIKTRTKSNQTNEKRAQKMDDTFVVKMNQSFGDVDNDGTVDLLVGGLLPGGAVVSSALNARPGNPIGGITIKGGKNPGGQMISKTIDNQGEFEFLNLEPGNYQFVIERAVFINLEVQIELITKTKHDTVKNSIGNIR